MAGTSIGETLAQGGRDLSPVSETPARDAQVVLSQVMGRPREWLLAHPEAILSHPAQEQWEAALGRLGAGEPLPYVLGWAEFYGRRFAVTPDVLIPRPETEQLVAMALEVIDRTPRPRRVIDLGTGSGCVGITLALERPHAPVIASDVSPAALRLASDNSDRLGAKGRITFVMADLALGLSLDDAVIVANLPYVDSAEVAALHGEPRLALDGGADGTDVIQRLLAQLARCRPRRATALLEIGAGQGRRILELASAECHPARVWLKPDLAGRDRIVGIEFEAVPA
jgi:release factor glutamine methyltransferase